MVLNQRPRTALIYKLFTICLLTNLLKCVIIVSERGKEIPQKRGVITMKEHVAFNLTTGELITTTGTGNFLKRLVRKAGKGEWIFTHSTFEGMMAKYSAMISR